MFVSYNTSIKRAELEGVIVGVYEEIYTTLPVTFIEFFDSHANTYYLLVPRAHFLYYQDNLVQYKNKVCKASILGITINNITRWKLEQLL